MKKNLAKLNRSFKAVLALVNKGKEKAERFIVLLAPAIEGCRKSEDPQPRRRVQYVLELQWAWDNSHVEWHTLSYEAFENMSFSAEELTSSRPSQGAQRLLRELEEMRRVIITPSMGPTEMRRLYCMLRTDYYGYEPYSNFGKEVGSKVDVHFVLEPICDFDDKGKPIPPKIVED
jgi:hypothetical protein